MGRLRDFRVKKGVSQQVVADYLGITRQAYSNYENENRTPDNETLLKLASYFDISVGRLIGAEKQDGYSKKFRENLFSLIENLPQSNDEKVFSDYMDVKGFCDETYPLTLAEAYEMATRYGETIDNLVRGYTQKDDDNTKSPDADKSTPRDRQEQQIMGLVGQMNTVQKEFLLALLHTVVVRSQDTPAFDLASTGETILKSEHLG